MAVAVAVSVALAGCFAVLTSFTFNVGSFISLANIRLYLDILINNILWAVSESEMFSAGHLSLHFAGIFYSGRYTLSALTADNHICTTAA